jgi:hypothetical protein
MIFSFLELPVQPLNDQRPLSLPIVLLRCLRLRRALRLGRHLYSRTNSAVTLISLSRNKHN